jgi:hypothetical protein
MQNNFPNYKPLYEVISIYGDMENIVSLFKSYTLAEKSLMPDHVLKEIELLLNISIN